MAETLRELDETDRAILRVLQREGRISNKDLAERVHLTPSPCRERVRRLEEWGFIVGYHARLDPLKCEQGLLVFIEVKMEKPESDTSLIELARRLPQILECHMISGAFDFLIKVRVPSMAAYRELVAAPLGALKEVVETRTLVVLAEEKLSTELPLD